MRVKGHAPSKTDCNPYSHRHRIEDRNPYLQATPLLTLNGLGNLAIATVTRTISNRIVRLAA